MIVNLQSVETEAYIKDISEFPEGTRENLVLLINSFFNGERLNRKQFKVFKIDKANKILEFKVKDSRGNWRAISTIVKGKYLVFIYAFHKKSQALLEKDKAIIRNRIKRIEL